MIFVFKILNIKQKFIRDKSYYFFCSIFLKIKFIFVYRNK